MPLIPAVEIGSLMSELHFCFLQGMPSPFFSRIARTLSAAGHRVTAIHLSPGDQLFWKGGASVSYRGTKRGWTRFLSRFLREEKVTHLLLLGERRKYHNVAVPLAREMGIEVIVTDFGYIRSGWMTLEREGMNGASLLPRDLTVLHELARQAPPIEFNQPYRDSDFRMACNDLLYSFSNVLFRWLYPFYQRSDTRPHPLLYFPSMGWQLLRRGRMRLQTEERLAACLTKSGPFYVMPLQLEHDFQIVSYCSYPDLGLAVREVISSFARQAPVSAQLLIKVHPWDPGLRNWSLDIEQWAAEAGVTGRVHFFEGGSLDDIIRASRGMIVINSTSGMRALQLGCPVKLLGQAVYDVPGLAFGGTLDEFWTDATCPPQADIDAFFRALVATTQIPGVFFTSPGLDRAVSSAVERILSGTVGRLPPGSC